MRMDLLIAILFLVRVQSLLSARSSPPASIAEPARPAATLPAPSALAGLPATAMTFDQKRRAEQLTSVFENGTPKIDYAAVEVLDDGRGYTAGRAGFTTATGDAYLVAERYAREVPGNPLAAYLPRLKQLADDEDGDTSGLAGFASAWRRASADVRFQRVQDAVVDELYYRPAMDVAATNGIMSALGRAILYDTIIQHGGGDDADSLSALVSRTTDQLGGMPKTGVPEIIWLSAFLDMRRQSLLQPSNRATQEVWAVSVGRVDVLRELLVQKNLRLEGPIAIGVFPYEAEIL